MNGWMNSTGHRNNILSTYNWEIGVGYANQQRIDVLSLLDTRLGRRSGVYPLIINRDAASTDSRNVSLYIYGSFQQMRLKNDNGAWGTWQTFQNNVTWTIANGVGTHTVTAELKNGSAVVTSSDTIYLSQADLPSWVTYLIALTFLYSIPQGKLVPAAVTLTPTDVGTSRFTVLDACSDRNMVQRFTFVGYHHLIHFRLCLADLTPTRLQPILVASPSQSRIHPAQLVRRSASILHCA